MGDKLIDRGSYYEIDNYEPIVEFDDKSNGTENGYE
jgi:hypothetical protein